MTTKFKPYTCSFCGRMDPWQLKPCYCRQTTMETPEKKVQLYYEHYTDGHRFRKDCPACDGTVKL